MSLEYRIGDVFERLAEIPDGTVDLVVTSPPFLALRSYLPADHPDKGKEIGSEATPAAFIDTLLALSAEWGRVLAPHGSLCVELGDTYSGAGGYGNPDSPNPAYGAPRFEERFDGRTRKRFKKKDDGWPLTKSLTGIPTLYPWSLAYGRNLLTGQPSPAGQWRIRNVIVWARPNPPVGALGDKFRPATSYITVACRGAKRYFDLDAVRLPFAEATIESTGRGAAQRQDRLDSGARPYVRTNELTHAGAPPLDWHADMHPEDGDWLWKLSTQPYAGSHYATFPMALPKRLIEAMCPLRVCTVCGRPSERIVDADRVVAYPARKSVATIDGGPFGEEGHTTRTTLGWSECDCTQPCDTCGGRAVVLRHHVDTDYGEWDEPFPRPCPIPDCVNGRVPHGWRTGVVLDPFAGSGTTLEAAQAVGRHAIGIDLDQRNGWLARERVGMFLELDGEAV